MFMTSPHVTCLDITTIMCMIVVFLFDREWDKELYKWRTGGKAQLWRALGRCYGKSIAAMGLLLLLQVNFGHIYVGVFMILGNKALRFTGYQHTCSYKIFAGGYVMSCRGIHTGLVE